jgi:hypothetical protein
MTFVVRLRKTETLPRGLSVVTITLAALYLRGDSVGNISIFGGKSIGHCEKRIFFLNMCLILSGCQDRAV